MATNTFTYATQANFKDYFPHLMGSDNKSPVYNWATGNSNFFDTSVDLYFSHNTGLVSQLYWDGAEIDKITFNTTQNTQVKVAINTGVNAIDVDDTTGFGTGDIIKINNEYMRVTGVTDGDTLAISSAASNRGLYNTAAQHHAVDSNVYLIIDVSEDVGDASSAGKSALGFVYDPDLDLTLLIVDGNDPNDYLVEAGTDYATFMNNQLYRASMELNNMLDGRFPNPIPKSFIHSATPSSDNAEYDAILVKLTSYIVAVNLQRANGDFEQADLIYEQITNLDGSGMVDKLNKGEWKLSFETDKTDSSGDIIEITNTGTMNLVETYGEWSGIRYDRVQIICTTAGAYGVAKYTIKTSDSSALYGTSTTGQDVTGGLDYIGNGLYVRFEGAAMAENDRWDIEVRNYTMKQTNAQGTRSLDAIRNDLSPAKIVTRRNRY